MDLFDRRKEAFSLHFLKEARSKLSFKNLPETIPWKPNTKSFC